MFRQKEKSRQFILGKSPRNSINNEIRLQYRKNIEKALVLSLAVTIIFFRLTTHLDLEKYIVKSDKLIFESIDLPEPPPLIEEPLKMQMEQVVEVQPEEEEEAAVDEEILKEIEDLLDEGSDEEQLQLASNDLGNLLSDSQLGSISGPEIKLRELRNGEARLSVGGSRNGNLDSGAALDIGKTGRTQRRSLQEEETGLDLDIGQTRSSNGDEKERNKKPDPRLGIAGKNARILSFASSTIGTEDYKLWNKLNAELDRLNKGRYGRVPDEIQRNSRGFIIRFDFADSVQHEIHWQQDGNVWIKVIGDSHKSDIQELRRSVNSLLRLSVEN